MAIPYVGGELDIFVHARNWKRYWSSRVAPWVRGRVLEVGAGFGANTPLFVRPGVSRIWALEPDPELAGRLRAAHGEEMGGVPLHILTGTLESVPDELRFDTVLYIDVLEHIADDRDELLRAAARLDAGGHLIVVAPAHQSLYTDFDRAIGHHRRYTRASLCVCAPPGVSLVKVEYLDSFGLLASLSNRWLRQSLPTLRQIRFWDRFIVRASIPLDAITGHHLGKSVLAVWKKDPPPPSR
jgi:SAM-dependent methyltransferase